MKVRPWKPKQEVRWIDGQGKHLIHGHLSTAA